jgi:hypothetical protein
LCQQKITLTEDFVCRCTHDVLLTRVSRSLHTDGVTTERRIAVARPNAQHVLTCCLRGDRTFARSHIEDDLAVRVRDRYDDIDAVPGRGDDSELTRLERNPISMRLPARKLAFDALPRRQ